MTLLLVHGITQYARSMLRISTWQLYQITGVSTWGLYTKCTICMLQVLVLNDCTICTIARHGIGTIIFLIMTVNVEYHIIVRIARDFLFHTSIVSVWILFLLVSAELIAVWVSILVNVSLEFVGLTICRPLQLLLQASTLDLDCDSNLRLGPTYL